MKKQIFEGAGIAIITPFKEDGTVNFERLGQLIDYQIDHLTDAIIICGTTGESSTLTDEEHLAVIEYAIKRANKRVPVIAGTGSNDTEYATHLSMQAEYMGADGVLLVTPYYNKTTQDGLVLHFGHIAKKISIPIILYNIPSRTGMNIDIPTMKRLSEIDNIVAVKEASGNISYCAKLIAECGDKLGVYSGNDDMILPVMSLGGIGVISVLSHLIPLETHNMVWNCLHDKFLRAMQTQVSYLDLINALFCEVNPIPVKAALNYMGLDVGKCRLPLCDISTEHEILLKKALWHHGLIK